MAIKNNLDVDTLGWVAHFLGDETGDTLELVQGDWKPEEIQGYNPYSSVEGKTRRLK